MTTHARYASIGALRMYYEDRGRGRPLLLLHGGGSTAQTSFGRIAPALARAHRVIAPEQQAHGHTADVDRPLSFDQMADDTAALLDGLGVREADVIGFSNGGRLALELALRRRALVRRLVLCSSYYARDGLVASLRDGFEQARVDDMPAALREAYRAAAPHPEALPTFFAKTVAMMRSCRDVPEAALRALDAPTLVLLGDADVIEPAHAARMAELLPRAELEVLGGCAHGDYLGVAETPPADEALRARVLARIEAFVDGD